MSRAAQEMQRLADELKHRKPTNTTGRRARKMVDHNNDKGLDIEPEAPPAAAAPAADQVQADAAQMTTPAEQAPEGADTMARTKKTTAAPRARKAAAAAAPAKPRAAGKAAGTTAAPAPKKERDPLAGIRDKPKLPGVLLGAEISRKVVLKALKGLDTAKLHDDSERREVARLIARIEARG